MSSYHLGILLALGTAFTWTGSALAFSNASRRVGSVPVNLIRLVIALLMLTAVSALDRGRAIPTDATRFQLLWLAASGVVGFFIGDITLFRAFVLIGPRRSTLLMSLAPAFASITGWLALGESLNRWQTSGIFVTLIGVFWVIAERTASSPEAPLTATATAAPLAESNRVSRYGIFLGFIAAAGQGIGAVMTKHAYRDGDFHAFASTQIRASAAIPLFAIFLLATGRSRETIRAIADGRAMLFMTLGAFLGPFLGVSMLNASIQRIPAGVTSTLAGMVPVFMLPVAAMIQRERVTLRAILGAVVAVAGVALLAKGD